VPLLDGFQFLQRLQKTHQKLLPFAFISAYVDAVVIKKINELGADCVIKKPVDQEALKIILLAIEKKHNLSREIFHLS
jgi:CheY-like chemotaxis protein